MGIMSVSILTPAGEHVAAEVSVPYGDHVCLNDDDTDAELEKLEEFPSPMGIMSVSMRHGRRLRCREDGFPSPMGIMSVSITFICYGYLPTICEFPSPMGIMSVSIITGLEFEEAVESFRPLWGSCLSQL